MPGGANKSALAYLIPIFTAGWPSSGSAAQWQALASSITPYATSIATDTTQPTVVQQAASIVEGASSAIASGTPTATNMTNLWAALKALVLAGLANTIVNDITTNGCSGYDSIGVGSFQSIDGIAVTSVYDAATVAAIQSILGSSVSVPAACAAASSGGGTSSGGGGTTPVGGGTPAPPATTSTSDPTTTALIVGASVVAIGTLAVLLYKSGKMGQLISTAAHTPKRGG